MSDDGSSSTSIYELSYCLNSLWGALICLIVAFVVTAITGTNSPEDLDETLVSPKSWSLFERSTFLQGREPLIKTFLRRSTSRIPRSESSKQEGGTSDEKEPLPTPLELNESKNEDDVECRGAV